MNSYWSLVKRGRLSLESRTATTMSSVPVRGVGAPPSIALSLSRYSARLSRSTRSFSRNFTWQSHEAWFTNNGRATHTQSFYCSSGICPGPPGWSDTRKVKPGRLKPIWIYCSKRQWVTVASAGLYASLHLNPDNHANIPPLSFFYRPDALPAAQPTASKHWRQ